MTDETWKNGRKQSDDNNKGVERTRRYLGESTRRTGAKWRRMALYARRWDRRVFRRRRTASRCVLHFVTDFALFPAKRDATFRDPSGAIT